MRIVRTATLSGVVAMGALGLALGCEEQSQSPQGPEPGQDPPPLVDPEPTSPDDQNATEPDDEGDGNGDTGDGSMPGLPE